MKRLNLCPYCAEFTDIYIETRRVKRTAKGVEFEYNETTGYCIKCNEPIYVPSIHDANIDAHYKAYWVAKYAEKEGKE